MAEAGKAALVSGPLDFTPPSKDLAPTNTMQILDTESSLGGEGKVASPNTTRNEILDRFLQDADVAQPPIHVERTVGTNMIDNVHDLQYALPKTIYAQIGKLIMPPLLQDLYGKIQVARSSHIFPRGSQERVGPYIHWADKGDSRLFGETQYKGSVIEYPIEKVCRIVDTSQDCEVSNTSEAVLRNEVVLRILSLAIKLSGLRDSVKLEHVSSSVIAPSNLIQTLHGVEHSSLPRKIDYCLYLRSGPEMERRIAGFLEASIPFGRSINQTDEPRTRLSLPLISIKVTKSLSQEDTMIPLSIWGSAGLERAAELFEERAKVSALMPVILISVRGPHWYLMFMHLDNLPIGGPPIRRLHGQILIGSTLDVKDCCALISSLVCLFKWTEKKHHQFLETYLPLAI